MSQSEYDNIPVVRCQVIDRQWDCDSGIRYKTPAHLVGKKGRIVEFENTAYDTGYPTGYERSYFKIVFDDGTVEDVDTGYVKKEDGVHALLWDDIKVIPRNFAGLGD